VGIRLKSASNDMQCNNTNQNKKMWEPLWGMARKRLRRSHVDSTQSHSRAKRAPKPMENFNMGAKMASKALTREPMIDRLYHTSYNTYKQQRRLSVTTGGVNPKEKMKQEMIMHNARWKNLTYMQF
jgi:hypothetical protein